MKKSALYRLTTLMTTKQHRFSFPPHATQRILDALFEGVYYVDEQRHICYWNHGAELMTGYTAVEVQGAKCSSNLLMHVDAEGRSLCQDGCPLQQTLLDGQEREANVYFHHKDGHRCPVHIRVTPLVDSQGQITGAIEVFSDNSRYEDLARQAQYAETLALLDYVTGISNRRHGQMVLAGRLNEFERYDSIFGVLFVDLDHFKIVNDTYGHESGDRVLRMVAHTLQQAIRLSDHVCRWGGEEFVVVISNMTIDELAAMAERIRTLVAASFLAIDDTPLHVTVSIGATLVKTGDTTDSLIARADQLLYRSKDSGRNRVTADTTSLLG